MTSPSPTPATSHNDDESRDHRVNKPTELMIACQRQNIDDVRDLLAEEETSDTVTVRDNVGKTALHYCVENSNIESIKLLLSADQSLIDVQDDSGHSALHLAAVAGNVLVARCLLEHGAAVNTRDNEQHCVVHWATACGHSEVIDLVCSHGADVELADIHGAAPLHYAAQLTAPTAPSSTPASPDATARGQQVLNNLLTKQENIDCRDVDKRTPLLWAASAGSVYACEKLVEKNADIEAADKDGLTALHCAASKGHVDCVTSLLNHGANVDCVDDNGCTPLFYAVTLGRLETATRITENNANVNHVDLRGRSPGHCAAAAGQIDCLKLLLSHTGNVWMSSNRGELPIHEAALQERNETVKYLLEEASGSLEGAPVNYSNREGRTCLHIAALKDNLALAVYLVERHQADKSLKWRYKGKDLTPYELAVALEHRKCADYLKPCSKEINIGENAGPTDEQPITNDDDKKDESITKDDEEAEASAAVNQAADDADSTSNNDNKSQQAATDADGVAASKVNNADYTEQTLSQEEAEEAERERDKIEALASGTFDTKQASKHVEKAKHGKQGSAGKEKMKSAKNVGTRPSNSKDSDSTSSKNGADTDTTKLSSQETMHPSSDKTSHLNSNGAMYSNPDGTHVKNSSPNNANSNQSGSSSKETMHPSSDKTSHLDSNETMQSTSDKTMHSNSNGAMYSNPDGALVENSSPNNANSNQSGSSSKETMHPSSDKTSHLDSNETMQSTSDKTMHSNSNGALYSNPDGTLVKNSSPNNANSKQSKINLSNPNDRTPHEIGESVNEAGNSRGTDPADRQNTNKRRGEDGITGNRPELTRGVTFNENGVQGSGAKSAALRQRTRPGTSGLVANGGERAPTASRKSAKTLQNERRAQSVYQSAAVDAQQYNSGVLSPPSNESHISASSATNRRKSQQQTADEEVEKERHRYKLYGLERDEINDDTDSNNSSVKSLPSATKSRSPSRHRTKNNSNNTNDVRHSESTPTSRKPSVGTEDKRMRKTSKSASQRPVSSISNLIQEQVRIFEIRRLASLELEKAKRCRIRYGSARQGRQIKSSDVEKYHARRLATDFNSMAHYHHDHRINDVTKMDQLENELRDQLTRLVSDEARLKRLEKVSSLYGSKSATNNRTTSLPPVQTSTNQQRK